MVYIIYVSDLLLASSVKYHTRYKSSLAPWYTIKKTYQVLRVIQESPVIYTFMPYVEKATAISLFSFNPPADG